MRCVCAQPPTRCDFLPCPSHLHTDISGGPWAALEPVTITGHAPVSSLGTREQNPNSATLPGQLGYLCSRQCHSLSFSAGPLWMLSSGKACVAISVSKEGFSQCTPDSVRALHASLPALASVANCGGCSLQIRSSTRKEIIKALLWQASTRARKHMCSLFQRLLHSYSKRFYSVFKDFLHPRHCASHDK